jgi:hypothetical protein
MLTCEIRLFVPKECFTAYVSGITFVDEIFCPALYSHGHGISSVVVIQLTLAVKQVLCISNATLEFLTWISKKLVLAF